MNEKEKVETPDFVELLEAFKEQLNYMGENSCIIYEKVNTIKDTRSDDNDEDTESKNGNGVISDLWVCVQELKKYNGMLNESKKSLIKLVG
jgi:hypothetical protein